MDFQLSFCAAFVISSKWLKQAVELKSILHLDLPNCWHFNQKTSPNEVHQPATKTLAIL